MGLWALALELTLVGYIVGPRTGYGVYLAGIIALNPVVLQLVQRALEADFFGGVVPGIVYSFAFATHLCVDRILGFGGPYPGRFATILVPIEVPQAAAVPIYTDPPAAEVKLAPLDDFSPQRPAGGDGQAS